MAREPPITAIGSETAPVEPTAAPPVEHPRPYAPPASTTAKGAWAERLVPIAVASALFMEFVDSTALSTALPTLARAFHSDPVHLKLALTSYLLTLAVFAPASGWVADRFGARRIFLIAMGVFLAGSVLCGLSQSLGQLVAARLVQGAGGAMMTPVGRLIVVTAAPRERFVAAMSWFTMPALVGPLVGPTVSGLILSVASWRMIFFVNIPVAVLGAAAVARFVPRIDRPHPGPFDLYGFVCSAVAITAIVVVSETVGMALIPPLLVAAIAVAGAVGMGLFLAHRRRTERPILDLDLLRYPTYRASLMGGSLVRLGLGATPLLLPLLLQLGLGWSPAKAGLVTIAQTVGALAMKPVAPGLIRRFGFRLTLLSSIVAACVFTAAPGLFRAGTPIVLMAAVLAVGGFVRSMHFTSANTLAYADVPQAAVSQAATLSTVAQQVSMSLGVSFGALMLHLTRGSGGALTVDRFTVPFLMIGLTTLLALPLYWRLSPEAGAALAGGSRAAR